MAEQGSMQAEAKLKEAQAKLKEAEGKLVEPRTLQVRGIVTRYQQRRIERNGSNQSNP
ncbi:MAG TPA: hypothetical protein VER35_03365 [Candidatus Limnocylindrales bacterium]|nr:hypothetical protein [Candidatus Limnocylindrales bacterium]